MFGRLFARHKQTQVNVGARYRHAESPLLVWEVADLFEGIDGTPYARIFCVNDTSRRKTVAQSSLRSGKQYLRLEG
ncbi:MAG TPA: hypothetical protein VHL08_02610 [Dongiaceae bacterium]|jgi:hypothetical protein|nr:hypothetical protein [Dongiaceae bacterium]